MSDYTPEVDDVVVRRDRDLGEWGRGASRGLTAYRVAAASPARTRVTLHRVDDPDGAPVVVSGGAVKALRPLTPEDQAEIDADSRWLLARRRAGDLEEWLRSWRQERPAAQEVERFLEASEALWKRKEGP